MIINRCLQVVYKTFFHSLKIFYFPYYFLLVIYIAYQ
nr:MAG TPA: hypothetical protein [Bacteriophage sp.]